MTVAKKIQETMTRSSWIRKMFEEGTRLKAEHGADKVFDFSLGNPNLPPPEKFSEALRDAVDSCGLGDHCYMPNTGYPQVCKSIAEYLSGEQGGGGFRKADHHDLRRRRCPQRDPQGDSGSRRRGDRPDAVFCGVRLLCGQPRRRAENRGDETRFSARSRCHRPGHRGKRPRRC